MPQRAAASRQRWPRTDAPQEGEEDEAGKEEDDGATGRGGGGREQEVEGSGGVREAEFGQRTLWGERVSRATRRRGDARGKGDGRDSRQRSSSSSLLNGRTPPKGERRKGTKGGGGSREGRAHHRRLQNKAGKKGRRTEERWWDRRLRGLGGGPHRRQRGLPTLQWKKG